MDEIAEHLRINTDLARKIIVSFIRETITKAGFERAVVALSGGIDSALTCFLSAEAMGPENVLAIRMPYATSSPDSLEDAQAVIDLLGVRSETIEITPMVDPFFERTPNMSRVRRGNVMARMRMIVAYDRSMAFNGLVVGSSNKTELLLGYYTLFGDGAYALGPIGDLYKTQVRQLARAVGVPERIIAKPPSADLWQGQTDEGELGFTYEEVDKLLYLLVDSRYGIDEAVEAGFERDFVELVWRRVQRTQFKRVGPIIPKLSRRAVGHDFLYLRDWGL